jgi:hypothetical protein
MKPKITIRGTEPTYVALEAQKRGPMRIGQPSDGAEAPADLALPQTQRSRPKAERFHRGSANPTRDSISAWLPVRT